MLRILVRIAVDLGSRLILKWKGLQFLVAMLDDLQGFSSLIYFLFKVTISNELRREYRFGMRWKEKLQDIAQLEQKQLHQMEY